MKLGEIINRLKQIYTEHIGVEYMHIWDHTHTVPVPPSVCAL